MYPQELLDARPEKYGSPEYNAWLYECRKVIEERVGQVWNTDEVTKEFNIEGFLAPLCYGTHRETGVKITLAFTHSPRFYYGLREG